MRPVDSGGVRPAVAVLPHPGAIDQRAAIIEQAQIRDGDAHARTPDLRRRVSHAPAFTSHAIGMIVIINLPLGMGYSASDVYALLILRCLAACYTAACRAR